jgi:hypothetical protein
MKQASVFSTGPGRREAALLLPSATTGDGAGGFHTGDCIGSSHFQTAPAKLVDRLGARVSFILGVHGNLRRQISELIADMPAVIGAIRARFPSSASNDGRHTS